MKHKLRVLIMLLLMSNLTIKEAASQESASESLLGLNEALNRVGIGKNDEPFLNNTGGNWTNLGLPSNGGFVWVVEVSGNYVYVGGVFNQTTHNTPSNNVMRYNLQTRTWEAMGWGVNSEVYAIAVVGNDVYVGGIFTEARNSVSQIQPASRIARWNTTTGQWSAVGTGTNGEVRAIAALNNSLYIGGSFSQAGGLNASNIARLNLNTNVWDTLGGGASGVSPYIDAIAVSGNDVYVGGRFSQIGSVSATNIARWNPQTNTWNALGAGLPGNAVEGIGIVGNEVFAGGSLPTISNIQRWNTQTNTWSALGSGLGSFGVTDIDVLGNNVFVTGGFTQSGTTALNRVARWNTQTNTWSALGNGIPQTGQAIAVSSQGDVFAGGLFVGTFSYSLAPTARLQPRGGLTSTSITLNGTINPNGNAVTAAQFEYSTDPTFTTSVQSVNTTPSAAGIGSGTTPVNVSAFLNNLTPNTIYYYRLAAENSFGRRVSDKSTFLTTASISTGTLALWFRADAIDTANGGIARAYDLSGNLRDGVMPNPAQRAVLNPNSTLFNNRPVMTLANSGNTGLVFPRFNAATLFIVARNTQNSPSQFIIGDSVAFGFSGGETTTLFSQTFANPNLNLFYNGQSRPAYATDRPTVPTVVTIQINPGSEFVSTLSFDRPPFNLTVNRSWRGDIAEVIIYTSPLSSGERIAVEDYLRQRYGIGLLATVMGVPATNITSTSATLNGSVNPNGFVITDAKFAYGTNQNNLTDSIAIPSLIGQSGTSPINVSASVSGLVQQQYFYRLVVRNASGIAQSNLIQFNPRPFNFPTGLPTDSLQLWLRGDFVDTVSGRVATWLDLSGREQAAVQSNAAIRPTFIANAVNGRPAIGFAGGNPPTLHQHFTINGNFRDFTAGMTAFVVANPTATANSARFFEFISSPNNSVVFIRNASQTSVLFGSIINSGTSWLQSSGGMVNNTYQILTGRRVAGSVAQFVATQLFRNGQTFGSGNIQVPVVADRTTNYIGRGQYNDNAYYQGEIAEMIIYNRALSDVEMAQVHNYLAQRYGIGQSTSANPSLGANQGGTFVLGNTGATVTFITPSSTAGSLSGSVTNSRPNVFGSLPTGITNLAERFWTINQTGLTGFSYALTLDLSTLGGVQNFANLKLLKRNNASSPWVNVETLPGVTITRNAPFITVAGLTSFSDFAIGSDASNQLPVELTEFGFRKADSGIELHWRTATELNNSGFEVERKSHGTDWNTLGFVRGNGTTTEAQSYSFLDRTASGKVQYRLKQIDFDGQFEYSNVIEVDAGLPKQFALEQNYPNPFNPTTTIGYQLPVASEVSLKVYDVLGREVMTLVNGRQDAGAYNITLNAATLSSGIYFYRLQSSATNGASSSNFVQTKKMMLVK